MKKKEIQESPLPPPTKFIKKLKPIKPEEDIFETLTEERLGPTISRHKII
jgi:hypothetical protein